MMPMQHVSERFRTPERTNKTVLAWVLTISMLIWANLLPAQEKTSSEKIRIAVATSSLAFLVPFVAKDRGLYLKNGSDVELIQMRPNIAMAALISGDIDYVELIGSVIRSAARNLPVRAISTGIRAPFFSIVAQTKYKSIKDLKGTVIGVASIGGTNQISTRITLKQLGLDPDKDIKFLAIGEKLDILVGIQTQLFESDTRADLIGAADRGYADHRAFQIFDALVLRLRDNAEERSSDAR